MHGSHSSMKCLLWQISRLNQLLKRDRTLADATALAALTQLTLAKAKSILIFLSLKIEIDMHYIFGIDRPVLPMMSVR